MSGKINLTIGEIQGNLKQVLEADLPLTAQQRYSVMAAIESMDFIRRLSPGLKKAMEEHKNGNRTSNGRRTNRGQRGCSDTA